MDAQTALAGHDLETATNLFGRYDARLTIAGRELYVWRRTAIAGGRSLGCELRVQTGYRQMIRATELQGFPEACQMFSVQYTSMAEAMRRPERPAANSAPIRAASGCPACRPVGSSTATATASVAGER